ncbi:glutamate decarboxylase [Tsukamurella pulmonis]|uniref:Glutamate decarboxylase n=1 Tax=Tsukamurella pulmonis TaxID=47312 RepID=A0A1H1DU68_9ACTN|nr:glutamate decarboxylase [Tsukamurella pulmonis]KXO92211.1 glutamate decarboxylase [Tsukamurella pulmonis]SDQ79768.1 glutamate decarboxylase [Tsukamurella pulmonis]SUP21696.1 Glutamate decarboxylase [Tsukamurella pulmonis]
MSNDPRDDEGLLLPAYAGRLGTEPLPRARLADEETPPLAAYRFVHDELVLDGQSRTNLATFVTTWMEPEGQALMAESFDKNAIDHDEYPATSAIESRTVAIVAHLFHAPGLDPHDPASATGASTIGSSEAVMLAGLAMKWRWRKQRRAAGLDASTPNLVLGSNVQVVWEKFCRYFDVEPVYLPIEPGRYVVTPEQVRDAVDENTIGAVTLLGTTFTGEYEDVAGVCAALDELSASGGPDVPVHVDAASGGFVAPFLDPDLVWDFRLPRVFAINTSGHKYGLTYPGIGFVIFRDRAALDEDLVFRVNYLGGDLPTFTLNFSRPGAQIIGQYYNFVRLGRNGYTKIMRALRGTAMWLAAQIASLPHLTVISDGSALPVVTFSVDDAAPFTAFDLSHELRAAGWQVPAYTMPADAQDVTVLRIVVREGFSGDLAGKLRGDVIAALARLDPRHTADDRRAFHH